MTTLLSLDTIRTVAEVLAWWTACGLVACLVWIVRGRPCQHRREHLHLGCFVAWHCLDCPHVRPLGHVVFGETANNYKSRRSV